MPKTRTRSSAKNNRLSAAGWPRAGSAGLAPNGQRSAGSTRRQLIKASGPRACRPTTVPADSRPVERLASRHERQPAVPLVDLDDRTVMDAAGKNFVGQGVLQIFLHRALQRSRAIDRIVADPPEPGARG